MFKKYCVAFTISAILFTAVPSLAGAALVNTNVNVSVTAIDQIGEYGALNWKQGVVEGVGTGVPSYEADYPAQARAMAKRAAVVDAQRNLLEAIHGVQVTAETTVQNFAIVDDTIKTKVSGIVKGAKIVHEQQFADGTYQIIMRINLFGHGSVAEAITNPVNSTTPDLLLSPSPAYKPAELPLTVSSGYTGLVIDVTGLPLTRAMSPVVFDDTGRKIYGHENIIPQYVISQGMIDYMCTPEDLRTLELGQSRAGTKPITVKALEMRDHNVNIIISQADADKILAANMQDNFLMQARVCVRQ
ncbi:LPP20 family lipoprotein [Sporomusa sp. GT1]|uniref:LPP20 family lipoprotein n=1 Tax=Sporomusa sp. GT1 TaxID=1534747 RepID=UPI00166C9061|nr:LPP20 family lipoprotein [Sporomusa sp. GT1]